MYQRIDLNVDYKKLGLETQNGFQAFLQSYILSESTEIPRSARRPAVIICPGGGYRFTSDREAEPVAMRFLAAGIHAFVLRYSTAPARHPCALVELASAVAMVRKKSEMWNIDPKRIIICGFSAGGHLCAMLGTTWNFKEWENVFKSQEKIWKPAGMILAYPVIMSGKYENKESYDNLLGIEATPEQRREVSIEKYVNADTLPAFIWHTAEDREVPLENSIVFIEKMRKYGRPFEYHVFEKGVHGLSLCDETTEEWPNQIERDNACWIDMAIHWIWRGSEANEKF